MAARAMWKGRIRIADLGVAVKLYAAARDRSVHFRLLHEKDHAPVKQVMVNPDTGATVAYQEAGRAWPTGEGDLVLLREPELEAIEPAPSRDIRILQFLPPAAIDHRWYLRPYYLGPDEGAGAQYAALTAALGQTGLEGVARWVMRKKEYVGALRVHAQRLMLFSLRHADEVVSVDRLEAPPGPALDKRELAMAQQLTDMLAGDFDPTEYRDEYRARVEALIEAKRRGGELRPVAAPKRRAEPDLAKALASSLERERKRA